MKKIVLPSAAQPRLQLSRETLRQLSPEELVRIAGGTGSLQAALVADSPTGCTHRC